MEVRGGHPQQCLVTKPEMCHSGLHPLFCLCGVPAFLLGCRCLGRTEILRFREMSPKNKDFSLCSLAASRPTLRNALKHPKSVAFSAFYFPFFPTKMPQKYTRQLHHSRHESHVCRRLIYFKMMLCGSRCFKRKHFIHFRMLYMCLMSYNNHE